MPADFSITTVASAGEYRSATWTAQARFHKLGTNPKSDPILMKRGLVAGVEYEQDPVPLYRHFARFSLRDPADSPTSDRRAAGSSRRSAMPSPARPNGLHVAGFDDEVTDLELDGNDLYLLVNKGSPRGRIVKTSGVPRRASRTAASSSRSTPRS